MRRGLTWAALLIGLPAAMTTRAAVIYRDVAELTAGAQAIVIGDVLDVASWEDTASGLIRSHVTIGITDYLLGTGPALRTLTMSGGTVGELTLAVSVLPRFQPGEHVLLFLQDTEIGLVESFQGAYVTDGVDVARKAPACGGIIPDSRQTLADLCAEIARALPPGMTLREPSPYKGPYRLPAGADRYALCGYSWAYQSNPMGENYVINANCADGSAGDANSQRTQIQNGPAAWNAAGADFEFTYGGTSSGTSVTYNNTNLVYFDTTPPDGGSYVAATFIWYGSGDISECDLVFNDRDYTWWNGSGSCAGMDIWNVTTHEFGHFLCLGDLYGGGDSDKTMYGYVSDCDIHARTLHSDDIAGIMALYGAGAPDTTPPTPNPMTFSTAPYAASATSMGMFATAAQDGQSPPVEYYFDFVSGGTGGTDSGWQGSTYYADTGLTANTTYTYRVKARDSASTPNETAHSSGASAATALETPTGLTFGSVTLSAIPMTAAGTFTNLTAGQSGLYFDSTTPGGDGGLNAWIQVTSTTATGLAANTAYTFLVKGRNRDGAETSWGPSGTKATLIETPTGITASSVQLTTINLAATGGLSNPTQLQSGVYFDSTTSGGDGGINVWVSGTTDQATGLLPNTLYAFRVKARNQEGAETGYSPTTDCAAAIETPTGVTFGTVTSNSIVVQAQGTLSNYTLGQSGLYFDSQTTGGDGGLNEWLQSLTDTATGLVPNTSYGFRVKARNQQSVETAFSSTGFKSTHAAVPPAPVLGGATQTTMTLDVLAGSNPPVTDCAIQCTSTVHAAWNGKWVSASGQPSTTEVWQIDSVWGVKTIQGLLPGTQYTFAVKARNLDLVQTALGPTATLTTVTPVGACCFASGTCAQHTATNCAAQGGTYQGDNTSCTPNPCPQPTGACCQPNGQCSIETAAGCSGVFQGVGTTCTPNPCPQPTGACCFVSGSCTVQTAADCAAAGGSYQGDSTSCSPNPCPQPTGACCAADGVCSVHTAAQCAAQGGAYQGDGTGCVPNPCPQPLGACCHPNGQCTIDVEAGCGGVFLGVGTSCAPNPCPQPSGACCLADGSCLPDETADGCVAAGGTYQGDDTSCAPNPCPQPSGACCFGDGSCVLHTAADCAGLGGAYEGDDTACAPNPCPQPTGACCQPDGQCTIEVAAGCGGEFLGVGTECTPNPCPPPICRGDCDCDGVVGFSDIDYFVAAIPDNQAAWAAMFPGGTPPPGCSFDNCDVNGDGGVGFSDIDVFVARIPSSCP